MTDIRNAARQTMRITALLAGLLGTFALAGCAGPETPAHIPSDGAGPQTGNPNKAATDPAAPKSVWQDDQPRPAPRIVHAGAPLQCVPYARRHVNISLRGAAWTWWSAAEGRYDRGRQPQVGSVLVLKRRGRSLGHIAVVTRINGPREIIVDHANWLNRGRIHLGTPVRDVSRNNDWSAVRVWHTPGKTWGRSAYPAYGFIYPGVGES
ncbi:MAG: CHAP domain-containing protein [Proteobacteria bacterium]|nr:CHAP domain-containing protein [Pseudomonadota bacterium]